MKDKGDETHGGRGDRGLRRGYESRDRVTVSSAGTKGDFGRTGRVKASTRRAGG